MTAPEAPTTTDPAEVTDEQTDEERQDEEHGGDTFPREYVEKLRTESKGYRERAKTAEANLDAAQRELFRVKVSATGKLASPDDLPYSADLLSDDEALTAAIDELVTSKPHYAARKPTGSVGQGQTGKQEPKPTWLGTLSRR